MDLEPGRRTVADTGPCAPGAVHGTGALATGTVCRLRPPDRRSGRYLGLVCGRYATTRSTVDLAALFEASDETGGGLAPGYKLGPTHPGPTLATGKGGRAGRGAPWGTRPARG